MPVAAIIAAQAGSGRCGAKTDPRLKPAAHEFEACLMKEFLEPLQRDALFEDGKDGGWQRWQRQCPDELRVGGAGAGDLRAGRVRDRDEDH